MSYPAPAAVPYQSSAPGYIGYADQLALLDETCDLYLRSGYRITSHTDTSFVLVRSYSSGASAMAILLLLFVPPLLILYLVLAVGGGGQDVVCLRINARGQVEESGDTLDAIRAERRNRWIAVGVVAAGLLVLSVILILITSFGSSPAPRAVAPAPQSVATRPVVAAPPAAKPPKVAKRKERAFAPVERADPLPAEADDLHLDDGAPFAPAPDERRAAPATPPARSAADAPGSAKPRSAGEAEPLGEKVN